MQTLSGMCARVILVQPILMAVSQENHEGSHRSKLAAAYPGGSFAKNIYIDAIGLPKGAPDENKAQNQIAAGCESVLCWWCSINKNVDWINYIYYNQHFINYTHDAIKGHAE